MWGGGGGGGVNECVAVCVVHADHFPGCRYSRLFAEYMSMYVEGDQCA